MIEITEKAIEELKKVRNDSFTPESLLRVSVVGGGCSGLSYKLDFVSETTDNDKTFEKEGISFCIDGKSALFIKGLTLDYSGGLNGKGFTFTNPNATKSCGCGLSFSVS